MRTQKKARAYEELAQRFGASFDERRLQITLKWSCATEFKREVCRKLPPRCKYVHNAYYCSEGIVVKLCEVIKPRNGAESLEEQLMKPVLYELRRIVDGKRPARLERRSSKTRGNKGYHHNGRKKGRRPKSLALARA